MIPIPLPGKDVPGGSLYRVYPLPDEIGVDLYEATDIVSYWEQFLGSFYDVFGTNDDEFANGVWVVMKEGNRINIVNPYPKNRP